METPRFSLAGLSGRQELVVSPGSPALRSGGISLAALGGTALGAGLVLAIGGAIAKSQDPSAAKFETAGLVTLSSGIVSLIVGCVLLANSGTTVEARPSDPPPSAPRVARAPHYWAGEF